MAPPCRGASGPAASHSVLPERDAEDLAKERNPRGEQRHVGIEPAAQAVRGLDDARASGAHAKLRVRRPAADAERANARERRRHRARLARRDEAGRVPLGEGDARWVRVAGVITRSVTLHTMVSRSSVYALTLNSAPSTNSSTSTSRRRRRLLRALVRARELVERARPWTRRAAPSRARA